MSRRGVFLSKRLVAPGVAVLLLLLVVAAVACSGADEEAATVTGGEAAPGGEAGLPTAADGEKSMAATTGGVSRDAATVETVAAEAAAGSEAPAGGNSSDLGGLGVAEQSLGRKVIANGSVQIEVERGRFEDVFNRATLLADTYGGYVVASQASGTGEEGVVRSGTVAIRVPSESFARAMTDAAKLGELRSRQVDSQDVTEEFVDLEARLANAEAQEKTLRALLDRAQTIDEVLQVRQVLASTQAEIEQLKGRLRFLQEHSSFSTVTISVFESGVQVASTGGWGFLDALRDAARGFVATINGMVVGLGEALPVLLVLAFIGWVAYRLLRPYLRARLALPAPAPRAEDPRVGPPAPRD